jgi:phage terminase Nu1 subunit (DNA packaging protein)
MRDKLVHERAFMKVKLDSNEIANAYRLSARRYDLEFYAIHDRELARKIKAAVDSVPSLTGETFKDVEKLFICQL